MPDTSIWNDYWHFDRLSSFDVGGKINYREEIAAGWQSFLGSLPDGASILDLCTGNGAIAVMAVEAGRREGKMFRVAAVDAADINPYLYVTKHRDELATVEFRPATPIEDLPWPAASFDAVISQYGVEYSDLSRSLPEIARVIAPGGRARLFLHAAEGFVVQRSSRAIAEIDFLLREVDLAGNAQRCLRAVTAVERGSGRTEQARLEAHRSLGNFEEALRKTLQLAGTAADPAVLRDYSSILVNLYQTRNHHDTARLIGMVEEIRTEWRNHRGRLAAMVDVAVTREGLAELAGRLRELGARDVEASDQMATEGLLGHLIEAGF